MIHQKISKLGFVVLLLTLSTFQLSAQIKMERLKITKEISIKLPTSFVPMSIGEINNKYVSARKPIAMFTGDNGLIDFGINKNSTEWAGNDLKILKSFYKANIQNLFSEVKFIQDDIIEISEREFVVFEFVSQVSDEQKTFGGIGKPVIKYTYIMYTLYEDNVLLLNFTCDSKLRAEWQPRAEEIMKSVRIK
ncbi:MAG: hypothetical protein JXR03_07655 [Cyclobacteriaceae bacterium]